jgi:two-component system NtrC family sensor kinase
MRFYKLLSFRLFLLVFLILTILSIGFSLYFIKIESEQYAEIARQCAQRTSEIVTASTRNSMLLNKKENTYKIMRSIAEQEAIEKICLYDKEGNIVFSTLENEIGQKVDMNNLTCSPCHRSSGELKNLPTNNWHNIFSTPKGYRILGYIKPIKNDKGCYTADCHFHSANQNYIGVLWIEMSLDKMDTLIQENKARMISTNIAITLILGLVVGIFLWFWVHVSVNKLIIGTREVSSGNLSYKIEKTGNDEMGILARSFNEMTGDLQKAKEEITAWSNQLEHRVKEKTEALENTQKRNLQIEKMASLGQLAATVAHELNNPMAGILTYSKLIQKKLNKDHLDNEEKEAILKNLRMIEAESARSGEIVKNMLLFSRQEAIDMKPHQIDKIIDDSLDLISHHLKLHNIRLLKDIQRDLPLVDVDENQMKQALLALYVNAVEAMENEGTLSIKTQQNRSQGSISIFIGDTGKGIPEKVKSQIFEPFFTTKNAVKGVGLGLSAVYAIIHKHQGEISVESEVDKGTTFEIRIFLKTSRIPGP